GPSYAPTSASEDPSLWHPPLFHALIPRSSTLFLLWRLRLRLRGPATIHLCEKRRHVMEQRRLDRAAHEGVELEYEIRGTGEPVVLVHAGLLADWFTPLLEEPALTDRYRVLSYHRIGYAGSSHVAGPVSFAQQAAHCRLLMRHVGIER